MSAQPSNVPNGGQSAIALIEIRGGPIVPTGKGRGHNRGSQVVGHATVDAKYKELADGYSWSLLGGYAKTEIRTGPDRRRDRRVLFLHQLIYEAAYGPVPLLMEIDHEDRNRWNCVASNLRLMTKSFNIANSKRRTDNTSGYRGVSERKDLKSCTRYRAYISKDGRRMWLGTFDDPISAAQVVNAAFARCFPGVALPNPDV